MNKMLSDKEMDIVKGIGIGMVAGAALGMLVAPKKKSKANMVGNAVKAAGEVISNITGVLS
ncbi:MAG: hypothetical protein IKI49_04805 [Oscillospiraceae bacterium]|nr:hypothetical protein [Oscillospiraceae bacterium]